MAGGTRRLHGTSLVAAAVGVVVTAALSLAAWTSHEHNEDHLLDQRAREASAVIAAAIPGIQTPLAVVARLADAADAVDRMAFEGALGPLVGEGAPFVSASIWSVDDTTPLVVLGEQPALADQPPGDVRAHLARSVATPMLVVLDLLDQPQPRLGYAFTAPGGSARFVAYAEAALPANRTAVVQSNSAFGGLDFALYIGGDEEEGDLLVASVDELPLDGRTASEVVAFGDTELLLVLSPTGELGGGLLASLPFLVAGVGVATSGMAAILIERLQRRRDEAQELARQNATLFDEQRRVAHTLQHSLLPQRLPDVEGVEIDVRYEPGVQGMEIGGDWYDVVPVGPGRFLAAVGDVSGRGLRAASVMASIRYATRALASQGDPPGTILAKLNAIEDPDRDGHFTTVVCALIDLGSRTLTVANAGHPLPLLLGDGAGGADAGARFLPTAVGPPIGVVAGSDYPVLEVGLDGATTLLLFTDGVFERRGEAIDAGMERLRQVAERKQGALRDVLDGIVDELMTGSTADDAAVLGLRWRA